MRAIILLAALCLAYALPRPAASQNVASQNADEAAIRQTLTNWMQAFNSRRTTSICDLFAPDLRFDYSGMPERNHAQMCAQLQTALTNPVKRFSYGLAIKEIIVAGDLAVVRLVWTETLRREGTPGEVVSNQTGMDIFRRQPDGSWKIIRYLAYDN